MKLSKYNYCTKNIDNELLLFNTLKGTDSFIKVSSQNATLVEGFLSGNNDISGIERNIYDELVKAGYVLPDSYDEEAKLRKIYLDNIADPQLLLTIIPTEKCNFRCKYCYESFPDKVMSEEIQDAIIAYLKKNLNKYSSLQVSWFGGEPLLAIDIIERLTEKIKTICSFFKKPFTASITSNGFLLNTENFKRLLKCNVLYYQITIDGTRDIHDFQRPHEYRNISTYDAVISNLKSIKDTVKNRMFRITIRSNFSRLHIDKIEEYKKTFYKMFGNDKRYQFFVRPVMDWGGDSISGFKDNLVDDKGLEMFYDKLMSSGCKLNYIYDDFLNNAGGVCYAGKKNSYVITSSGDIYKCTCNFDDCPEAKIGHISVNGSMFIDEGAQNKWLCDFSNCKKDCFYSPICLREACSANRVLNRSTKNKCPLEKRNLSKILQLLDSENNAFRRID